MAAYHSTVEMEDGLLVLGPWSLVRTRDQGPRTDGYCLGVGGLVVELASMRLATSALRSSASSAQ